MKSIGLSEHLAVEVRDLDLSLPLSVEEVAELRTLWNRHLVLRFRAQTLTDDQLMMFSRNFGELDYAPMGRISAEERARLSNPYVAIVSNIVEDGRHIGDLGALEAHWHTDLSYVEEPVSGSVLYAVEVPPSGGDTSFTSMHAAYDALPAHLRERVSTLSLKHTASHDSAGELRRGHEEATDPRDAPGPVHPLTVAHPETGRRALLLGRRQLAYIPALSVEDSEALLDEALELRRVSRVHVDPAVARGRRADVGQPGSDAPPRSLRLEQSTPHAPHSAKGEEADRSLGERGNGASPGQLISIGSNVISTSILGFTVPRLEGEKATSGSVRPGMTLSMCRTVCFSSR